MSRLLSLRVEKAGSSDPNEWRVAVVAPPWKPRARLALGGAVCAGTAAGPLAVGWSEDAPWFFVLVLAAAAFGGVARLVADWILYTESDAVIVRPGAHVMLASRSPAFGWRAEAAYHRTSIADVVLPEIITKVPAVYSILCSLLRNITTRPDADQIHAILAATIRGCNSAIRGISCWYYYC
jgi:hypothetical protein